MASYRYTRDSQPNQPDEQPIAPLTGRKKWEHFWYYYKWHVWAGVFVAFLAGIFIKDIITHVEPDYTIGVITHSPAAPNAFRPLEQALLPFVTDINGDGKTVISMVHYPFDANDPNTQIASSTRLIGDLQTGESAFFLTDDAVLSQMQFGAFVYRDGTVPPEGQPPNASQLGYLWKNCPVLTALKLEDLTLPTGEPLMPLQTLLSDYAIVQRAAPHRLKPKAQARFDAAVQLYQALTKGAE